MDRKPEPCPVYHQHSSNAGRKAAAEVSIAGSTLRPEERKSKQSTPKHKVRATRMVLVRSSSVGFVANCFLGNITYSSNIWLFC